MPWACEPRRRSLTGFNAGMFSGAVEASFAGDTTDGPSNGSGSLNISPVSGSSPFCSPRSPTRRWFQAVTVTVPAFATDSNPAAVVFYSLAAGRSGARSAPKTGVFSWSVPASQALGNYPVTIEATDNSIPPLTDETSFTIEVMQATVLRYRLRQWHPRGQHQPYGDPSPRTARPWREKTSCSL